jgi:hypothetical protein
MRDVHGITTEVFAAFIAGKPLRTKRSVWTDGTAVYSYTHKLLTNPMHFAGLLLNTWDGFSATTKQVQEQLRALVNASEFSLNESRYGC